MTCPFCDRPDNDRCRFCTEIQAAEDVYCRPGTIPPAVLGEITERHRPLTPDQRRRLKELRYDP
jgi:hypothetical protein